MFLLIITVGVGEREPINSCIAIIVLMQKEFPLDIAMDQGRLKMFKVIEVILIN